MKINLAAMAVALTAVLAVLAASRNLPVSEYLDAEPVAASPTGSPQLAKGAAPWSREGGALSGPEGTMRLQHSEAMSLDAPDASRRTASVAATAQAPAADTASAPAADTAQAPAAATAQAPAAAAAPAVQPPDDQVAVLKQLLAQSRRETRQLGQIDDHLASLRQQGAEDASQRQDDREQEAAQHEATLEALATLRKAEVLLETGNADGVVEELGRAEAALSGRTLLDVEAAREALAREDLFPARQFLAAALAERRVPR
jgi:hypothetical protein